MPNSESLLSHFIASCGAASVSKSAMQSWLEGLQIWNQINEAPWNGSHSLKRVVMGASKFVPSDFIQARHEPMTIEHLRWLCRGLDLLNSFEIMFFFQLPVWLFGVIAGYSCLLPFL